MAFSDILKIVPFSDVVDGNVFFEGIEFEGNTQSDFAILKKLGTTGLDIATGDIVDYEDDSFVFVVKQTITTELKFTLTVKITNAHQPVIDKIESLLLGGTDINFEDSVLANYMFEQDCIDINNTHGWNGDWLVQFAITPYPTEGATLENSAGRARTHVHGTNNKDTTQ